MRKNGKNKAHILIKKVLVYGTLYVSAIIFFVWSFNQITVYR